MAQMANDEMLWRSRTCQAERTSRGDTFSKTSISIFQPATVPKIESKKATKVVKESKVDAQSVPKMHAYDDKIVANDLTKNVNVSLTISRNQNASISASCFFPHKQHQQQIDSTEQNRVEFKKDKKASQKQQTQSRPMLKIVEIPFEENFRQRMLPLTKLSGCRPKIEGTAKFSADRREDYRVVSLDVKPTPGRLEDFIPEIERKQQQGDGGIINNNNKFALGNERKCNNIDQTIGRNVWKKVEEIMKNNTTVDEVQPLERDEHGRILIAPEEWRKFMAEQRPQTSVPLKTQLQIIHNKDKYNFADCEEKERPKIVVDSNNVKDGRNIAGTFPRQKYSKWS